MITITLPDGVAISGEKDEVLDAYLKLIKISHPLPDDYPMPDGIPMPSFDMKKVTCK